MKKYEFTIAVAKLIQWIKKRGWYPLLDYAYRSQEEQQRLYNLGFSKCDGVTHYSAHQYGMMRDRFAVDIYIHDGDNDIQNHELYTAAHLYWESLGGRPMIQWDQGHFEV